MTTKLNKAVTRQSKTVVRDRSKRRPLIITIYPGNDDTGSYVGIRMMKTRKEEFLPLETIYHQAIRARVFVEKMDKAKAKKLKKKRGY